MTDAAAAAKPPVVQSSAGNAIIINPCQRLNPLLETIRNVNKEFGDIVPDFQVGKTTGVLFLSLKYHRLHPEYIYQRIEKLGSMFTLRILLMICDINEHQDPIKEITKTCIINNITIMVAWKWVFACLKNLQDVAHLKDSLEEAGFYLSTFKAYEHKPPDLIKERVDKDFGSIYRSALTSVPKINKTDVETLKTNIGSLADIASAPPERMQLLPGLGRIKVRRLKDSFEKPFHPARASRTTSIQSAGVLKTGLSRTDTSWNPDGLPYIATASPPTVSPATIAGDPSRRSPVWDIELDLNESDTEM